MIGWVGKQLDAFRGRGESAATVPPMDGALRPNTLLDAAPLVLHVERPDNLAVNAGAVLFSSGTGVLQLSGQTASLLHRFDSEVTCLAVGPDGSIAAGLADGSIRILQNFREIALMALPGGQGIGCWTAMVFRNATTLIACQGSAANSAHDWKHDLMQRGRSGAVWEVSIPSAGFRQLCNGLAFPYGVVALGEDLIVTEAWRHRLIQLSKAGAKPLLSDLPGYPSRIVAAAGRGYWLTIFAPRSPLIEFVLRERGYCERMLQEIEPDYWLAPSLAPPRSFLEPMQGGALRMHSILKPWAPTRSYGLMIRLDDNFRPVASYHSRTDGARHGVTSCLDVGGRLLVASKGGDAIVELQLAEGASP